MEDRRSLDLRQHDGGDLSGLRWARVGAMVASATATRSGVRFESALPCESDGGAKCKGFIALKRLDVPSEIWWEMIFPLRFGEARVDGSAHRLLRRELLPKLELFGLIELARRGKSRRLLVRTTPLFSEALSFCI